MDKKTFNVFDRFLVIYSRDSKKLKALMFVLSQRSLFLFYKFSLNILYIHKQMLKLYLLNLSKHIDFDLLVTKTNKFV